MRYGTRGLPIVILGALLGVAAPVRAADEGPIGVVEDVVVVRAQEVVPGRSSGDDGEDPECAWEVAIEDDQILGGVYSVDGQRLFSDTGRWFQRNCGSGPVQINGLFVVPDGGGFELPDMLVQAVRALDPAEPPWASSPDGVAVPMVAQMPVWLWVESSYWGGRFVARAETPSGRVWAEAVAVPVSTSWNPGDGSTVLCPGGGTPYVEGNVLPGCSHLFAHSSSVTGDLSMSVAVTFDVLGTTSSEPAPQPAGQISRSSAPLLISVGEIQAIETRAVE